MKYSVILTRDEKGDWLVPAFPGCHTWGATREEALTNAREALEGCIESLRASGDPLSTEPSPQEIEFVHASV